ncbi:MAG: hypothetical protein HYU99_10510 [Deltaproteobacteria bacterium]|nr:hypothetical protein [Deltaproteobacteria bacterium]
MAQNMILATRPYSSVDSLTRHSARDNGFFYESYSLGAARNTKFKVGVSSFKFNPRLKLLKGDELIAETSGAKRYYDAGWDWHVALEGALEAKTAYRLIVSSEKKGATGEFSIDYTPETGLK